MQSTNSAGPRSIKSRKGLLHSRGLDALQNSSRHVIELALVAKLVALLRVRYVNLHCGSECSGSEKTCKAPQKAENARHWVPSNSSTGDVSFSIEFGMKAYPFDPRNTRHCHALLQGAARQL